MSNWNFDKVIDRHNTCALKLEGLKDRFGSADLIPLWIADMDFEVCDEIVSVLNKRMCHHIFGYSCPRDEYWQSIINWQRKEHGFDIAREEIDYVPGVVKGIALAVNYFTEKGDKIVIQPPVYHPFKSVVEGNNRIAVENPLIPDGDLYTIDFDGLEEIFKTQKPVMMILCNPHNPVGIIWSKEVLTRLAKLCKQYGVKVISDEIHGDLALFGNKNVPFATSCKEAEEISITLGAPSKTFNIPGLVSSWVVVKNPELRNGFFTWLAANEFNEPTFVATLATEAAYNNGGEWLKAAKHYIEENILAVEDFCEKNIPGVKAIRPQASFLVWLDCRGLNMEHDKLIDLFVNHAGLALNDGLMFGAEGNLCMRLNVATSRAVLIKALERLAEAIKETKE